MLVAVLTLTHQKASGGSVDDKELLFPGDAGTGVSERPLVLGVVLVFFVLPVWC